MYSDDTESDEGTIHLLVFKFSNFIQFSEIMQINPIESEWRNRIATGDFVDAKNPFDNWCLAQISDVSDKASAIEFDRF